MTSTFLRTIASLTLVATLIGAAAALQQNQGNGKLPKVNEPDLVSAVHCIGCHGEKNSEAYKSYEREGNTKFILLYEHRIWRKQDLHSQAFKNIVPKAPESPDDKGNLAWRMQQILQRTHGTEFRVDKQAECLTCHAVDRHPGPVNQVESSDQRFLTTFGVSCESCHGFAEKWIGEHFKKSWRATSPADKAAFGLNDIPANKRAGYGLVDLRSPQVRAEKCASCHVGNKDEGKFVTHEMYAAGHAPLPAFEPVSYARQARPHYYSHRDNKQLKQIEDDWKNKVPGAINPWEFFHYRSEEVATARALAVGSIAAFRASMDLLAKEAGVVKPDEFLDFAHFDCAACHHDLKYPSDRQSRGQGIPGRPLMKTQTELLNAVLDHASSYDANAPKLNTELRARFDEELDKLHKAFDARPFGDTKEIQTHARELANYCDRILAEINAIDYTAGVSQVLLNQLGRRLRDLAKKDPKTNYLDHDSAQQLTWAILALRAELEPAAAESDKEKLAREKLGKTIGLSLRKPDGKDYPLISVEARLPKRLDLQYGYQQEQFLKAMVDWLDTINKD